MCRYLFILLVAVHGLASDVCGQVTERHGFESNSYGTHFMVAFPAMDAQPTERPRAEPLYLDIVALHDAVVTVRMPTREPSQPYQQKSYTLQGGTARKIAVDRGLLPSVHGQPLQYGIEVLSTAKISVRSHFSWAGNGDAALHLPTALWGREYVTFNGYQDQFGTSPNRTYTSSQILVIAAEDNTSISITPKTTLRGSAVIPEIRGGTTGTFTLNKGEVVLFLAAIDQTQSKNVASDLSGTLVTSSKPIGVVSGHTKGAPTAYPDMLPETGAFWAPAHFVRSNYHDVMLPTSMAGTEFVTVPLQYTPTRTTGYLADHPTIDDDRGDLIRVVALHDSTIVSRKRRDGSEFFTVAVLSKGEVQTFPAFDHETVWRSNLPVCVAQYGKSWAKIVPGSKQKGADDVQGHPTVEAGLPFLMMVPPINRSIRYAAFQAVSGLDNFVNIVVKNEHARFVSVNGRPLSDEWASNTRRHISGTPYHYFRLAVGAQLHTIESKVDSAVFMAWSYGSMDGINQGQAYGSVVGFGATQDCGDRISVTEQQNCGVLGTARIQRPTNGCDSRIIRLVQVSVENASIEVTSNLAKEGSDSVSYRISPIDALQPLSAVIRFEATTGQWLERSYALPAQRQTAPRLLVSDPDINLGALHLDSTTCRTVAIRNDDVEEVVLSNPRALSATSRIAIEPAVLRIPPGEQAELQICVARSTTEEETDDVVIASLDCGVQELLRVRAIRALPRITTDTVVWASIPLNSPATERPVTIQSTGIVPLTIRSYSVDWFGSSEQHFSNFRGLDPLPIIIPPGESYTWYASYTPLQSTATHEAVIQYVSDAGGVSRPSVLRGSSTMVSVNEDGALPLLSLWPNPAADVVHVAGFDSINDVVSIVATNTQGLQWHLPVQSVIPVASLPSGIYSVAVQSTTGRQIYRLAVVR